MKTLAFGPCFLALAVASLTAAGRAAPLPSAPAFSTAPMEVPSLGLKDHNLPQIIPEGLPTFAAFSKPRTLDRSSSIDRMPIAKPNARIDYALIVKAPDPKIDYKILLRETEPPPASK